MPFPNPFYCCDGISGEAEDRYIHVCDCPEVRIISTRQPIVASLIGIRENGVRWPVLSGGLIPSVPPKSYLHRQRVDNYQRTTTFDSDSECSGSTETRTSTSPSSTTRSVDPVTENITFGPDIMRRFQGWDCIDGDVRESYDFTESRGQGIDPAIVAANNGGTFTQTSITVTLNINGPNESGSRTISEFLSVEDTEQNAINRETPPQEFTAYRNAESGYSDRNTGYTFRYEPSKYAIILKNLVAGIEYRVKIQPQISDFIEGQGQSYTDDTPIELTHTATKAFHIFYGTLNSSISDEDFINNNYTLSASAYGLPSGTNVVTASQVLPITRGKIRKIPTFGGGIEIKR